MHTILQNSLVRFFLVSGLNTIFGYGMFVLLIAIGLHYSMAVFIGTLLGILFNFKTIGTLVFKKRNNRLIFKFFMVYGIIYLVNVGCLTLLKHFGMNVYVAGALLLIPIGLIAFLLNKLFVFHVKQRPEFQKSTKHI
jgi:putative flippase GtrA